MNPTATLPPGTAPAPANAPAAPANGAPAPAPAGTALPEKPAAPDGFISIADHQAAVENARKEEKAKLYPDLDAARKSAEALTALNATLTGENQTLKTSIDALKAATDGAKKLDIAKLVEEVTLRAAKTVADNAQTQITTLQTQVNDLTSKLNASSLKETRDRLIVEAGGPDAIIPELVKGNNEAELRESIASSKSILERSLKSRGITAPPATGTPAANGTTPPANGAAPAAPLNGSELPPAPPAPIDTGSGLLRPTNQPGSGTRHSPAEWKSIRDAKLREAQGRYPSR